jgi:hypothetical protein
LRYDHFVPYEFFLQQVSTVTMAPKRKAASEAAGKAPPAKKQAKKEEPAKAHAAASSEGIVIEAW